ncbi:transcriptional regulator domain-containing protein [Mesorhizobium sp. ES1-6]|uniref:transcriptional regulator domain-containing protein n=1 Tax=Mesorhizobium sp. ES1-6 TaxID=2876626 RepID=UPI001CCB5D51|nr:DUF6499 domain-containing protein [Mesorhizobium sp. ES1-6]MBZ9803400.1 DUF6499 domain-containing protein [Mesorhizobium sp. ES1-6]
MSRSDWADPGAYEHMCGYEADKFAAEYLIRNADFAAECSRQASRSLKGEVVGSPDFADRWGARFHNCRRASILRTHHLDGTGFATGSSRNEVDNCLAAGPSTYSTHQES